MELEVQIYQGTAGVKGKGGGRGLGASVGRLDGDPTKLRQHKGWSRAQTAH